MDTTTTTAFTSQYATAEKDWRIFLTTPGLRVSDKFSCENMVDPPTLELTDDGTMRVAFAPEKPRYRDDDDPWLTVVNVSHVPAVGMVVLTTDHAEWGIQIVLMSEEEYHSQV